jgi:argininosuccinate lyase
MTNNINAGQKMWGGRFNKMPSNLMQEINQSISFDYQLYKQDIQASIAHSKMLAKCQIITTEEADLIISGLQQIRQEISNNQLEFKIELEDIHMNIESRLKEIIGDVAGKLHTARSRNDQVATDFRLWIRDAIDEIKILIINLIDNLLHQAKLTIKDKLAIMPGFTHLQIAQPVLFSHHLIAYIEMFKRDFARLNNCRANLNQSPLGSAALAGTSFAIDRHFTAELLSFDSPCENSMDGVSDRDFAIEFLSTLSIIAVHLSRFGEELILWSSTAFNFITLPDDFTSGSSIMPQKKNPDAAELIRGKSGRIFGSLFSLLTVIKGLTLTYSKDMQEDKEAVFDAVKNIKICLEAASGMIANLEINYDAMYNMAKKGHSTATDLADYLVKIHKLPFRDAHHITGRIVRMADDQGIELYQLSIKQMQEIFPDLSSDILQYLTIENSINSRNSFGGTSINQVRESIIRLDLWIKNISKKTAQ